MFYSYIKAEIQRFLVHAQKEELLAYSITVINATAEF